MHGGTISSFSSVGIPRQSIKTKFNSRKQQDIVDTIDTVKLPGDVEVEKDLMVVGTVKAQRIETNVLEADSLKRKNNVL